MSWGQGAKNNNIDWGQGDNNDINWGIIYADSYSGDTALSGVYTDPDAQAFISAYSISDPTQQTAVNQLTKDLKSSGLWDDAEVILPFVGGTAASHRGDLKTATNKVTWYGGITHNSNGVKFNGTTGYGDVDWSASAGNLYDRSFTQYLRNVSTDSTKTWQGIFDGTNVFGTQSPIVAGNLGYAVGLNTLGGVASPILYGQQVATVTSGTNASKYYSTDVVIQSSTANASPTSGKFFIGALNSGGSAILFGDQGLGFVMLGKHLTQAKITSLNTILTTYNTTLGRNV